MISILTLCFFLSFSQAVPLHETSNLLARNDAPRGGEGGFSLPIRRTELNRNVRRRTKRQDVSGTTGFGDNNDLLYTVPIKFGDKVAAVHLDTGSSDLWGITEQCKTGSCANLTPFTAILPSGSLNSTDISVNLEYGDSQTGTHAAGVVAVDTLTIAGIAITNQAFAAVNDTTNTVVQFGASGIFGLGFPSGSGVQEAIVTAQNGTIIATDAFVKSTWKYGPLLSRISMTHMLEQPIFTVELQRSTIDVDGSHGQLTVGKYPDGVDPESVTWAPIKLYPVADGGLQAPSFAPNETYPFRWEIDIDGVFLDGKPLADSAIPASSGINSTRVTALIDTGNSLLRGPKDVIDNILGTVSPSSRPGVAGTATFPCTVPHRLEFKIGGKMFPIDPRDFITQTTDANTCVADKVFETDAPGFGATFRWSLGDPFFKSNFVLFHYGNLTHPSVDPPRIGLLSRVPADADAQLTQAVNDAKTNGGRFESTLQIAPTDVAATASQVTVSDDPSLATRTGSPTKVNSAGTPIVTINMDGPNGGSKQNSAISSMTVHAGGVVMTVIGIVLGSVLVC